MDTLQKRIAVTQPIDSFVHKQWANIEDMLITGTATFLLTRELNKLVFLCDKAVTIMNSESSLGIYTHEDLHTRLLRVELARTEAQGLLNRMDGTNETS